MNYSFKTLWNRMFAIVTPVWALLAWMIWSSGQLATPQHQALYLFIVVPGFLFIYLSGFMIRNRHARKRKGAGS